MFKNYCPFCQVDLKSIITESNPDPDSYLKICPNCRCDTDSSMPRYVIRKQHSHIQQEYGIGNIYVINNFLENLTSVLFLEKFLIVKNITIPLQTIDLYSTKIQDLERKIKLWKTFS